MTIRDINKFIRSLPDWSVLSGCFGNTAIAPMDIDGCVERKGRCLFLEHKGRGAYLSEGQVRVFRALAKQGNTVISYWTDDDDHSIVLKMRIDEASGWKFINPASMDDLRESVSRWFERANLGGDLGGGDAQC